MMCSIQGVSAFPDGERPFTWVATVDGPEGTVYEGLKYRLSLEFSSEYPYKAPCVRFMQRCFHPNVDSHGHICLDILKEKWSALYTVSTILLSVRSLLAEPNIDSPLNNTAAVLWGKSGYRSELTKFQAHQSIVEAPINCIE